MNKKVCTWYDMSFIYSRAALMKPIDAKCYRHDEIAPRLIFSTWVSPFLSRLVA